MRYRGLISLAGAALIFIVAGSASADVDPEDLLDDLIRVALRSNPAIAAEEERAAGAEYATASAGRLPDPALRIGYSPVPVETRGGPQRARASIEQSFPFFGKRGLRQEIAEANARAAEHRKSDVSAAVVLRVKGIFWQIYRIDRAIETAEREEALLEDIVSAAEARYVTGGGSQASLLQAQLMSTRMTERLIRLRGEREAASKALAGATGAPVSLPRTGEARWAPVDIPRAVLPDLVREGNPSIAASGAMANGARSALDLAGKNFYPDFALSAGWGEIGPSDLAGDFNGRDTWSVGAMLRLPLYRGSLRNDEKAAAANLRAAEESASDAFLRAEAEAASLADRIEAASASIEFIRDGLIPQARSAFESAMAAYGAGTLEFADLALAERTLLDTELSYHETVASWFTLFARLERIAGVEGAEVDFPRKGAD